MTSNSKELIELAERVEMAANNTLKSADWFWGWRRRDKKLSIAFGALSRDLREISERIRATQSPVDEGGR